MKMVDWHAASYTKYKVAQPICFLLLFMACASSVSAALVTSVVTFDESDDFSVSDPPATNPSVNGGVLHVIDGMRFSITGGAFLYPQNKSGLWPSQASGSTSLGSAASSGISFSMTLDDPYAGQTFDMHEITLYGYAQAASAFPTTSVEFVGTKLNGDLVSDITVDFDPGSRDAFLFDFEDDTTVDFSGLVSLTWNQRGTNRQFQFDNVTFSTVTAVPEPGTFLTMIALTTIGFVTRGRRWIVKRLQVV